MLWYKVWRESSLRFLISALAIAGVCLVRVLFEPRLFPGVAQEAPAVHNYIQYLYWTIFGGAARGLFQLCCLLLGLGGLQRDRNQNSLAFTLALPVSRPRLVVTRAAVGFVQVFALSLLAPFLIWATSPIVHQSMPLSYGLGFIPYWTIGGFFTFGVTFLCSVIFTSEYTALADPATFARWLAPLRTCEWVVYARRPFAGPEAVLEYLAERSVKTYETIDV